MSHYTQDTSQKQSLLVTHSPWHKAMVPMLWKRADWDKNMMSRVHTSNLERMWGKDSWNDSLMPKGSCLPLTRFSVGLYGSHLQQPMGITVLLNCDPERGICRSQKRVTWRNSHSGPRVGWRAISTRYVLKQLFLGGGFMLLYLHLQLHWTEPQQISVMPISSFHLIDSSGNASEIHSSLIAYGKRNPCC